MALKYHAISRTRERADFARKSNIDKNDNTSGGAENEKNFSRRRTNILCVVGYNIEMKKVSL